MQRRGWWALGTVLVAAALWFVWAQRPDTERVESMAEAAPAASDDDAALAPVASAPELPLAGASVAGAHGVDEVELCGGLWVKAGLDGRVDQEDRRRATRLPELRARLLDDLRADSGELARAVAVWFGIWSSEDAAHATDSRDTLVRMATTTSDPQVYALAFNSCGPARPVEGVCQLLNAEQWARLDPDNAAPWLFVLAQAAQRRDPAAQNEALFHIAASKHNDQHFFAIPGLVIDHMPGDEASIPAVLTLANDAIGVEAAWTLQGYPILTDMCKSPALRDVNRRQVCASVAELLVEHSDSLLDLGVGVSMGKRLGWSDERVERLRGEAAAYGMATTYPAANSDASDCASFRRDLEMLKRHARLGDAGALREWVAHSDKSAADFVREEQERRGRAIAAAEAAAAAAAASAASASSAAS